MLLPPAAGIQWEAVSEHAGSTGLASKSPDATINALRFWVVQDLLLVFVVHPPIVGLFRSASAKVSSINLCLCCSPPLPVELLQGMVSQSLGSALGQQVCSLASEQEGVGPISLPRRAETFGGFDSHQMSAGKGEQLCCLSQEHMMVGLAASSPGLPVQKSPYCHLLWNCQPKWLEVLQVPQRLSRALLEQVRWLWLGWVGGKEQRRQGGSWQQLCMLGSCPLLPANVPLRLIRLTPTK